MITLLKDTYPNPMIKWRFSTYKTDRVDERKALFPAPSFLKAITLCSILTLLVPHVAYTQTLTQITQELLASGCTELLARGGPPNGPVNGNGNGPVNGNGPATFSEASPISIQTLQEPPPNIPFFGPDLNDICDNATSSTVPTGGGAGATEQTSYVSIRNSTILSRLENARAEIDEPGPGGPMKTKPMPFPMTSLGNGLHLSFLGDFMGLKTPSAASSQAGTDSAQVNLVSSRSSLIQGLGLFASGIIEGLDRDVTTFQDGYDSTIFGFTAGGDYRFTNKFLAGFAFTYTSQDADFTGGGDFNTKSYVPTLFASYLPTQESFIQVVGGYTRNNFNVNRLATYQTAAGTPITAGTASSDAYGNVWSLAFLLGYDKAIRNFTLGPRLGLNWSNINLQDYQETGQTGLELAYNDQWVNSLQSIVGIYANAAYSTRVAVLVPQITADYIHEFANSQRFVESRFVQDLRANPARFNFQNEKPVRNFFNLGIGLSAVFPNGMQPYGHFRAMVGNEQFNNYAGILGLRIAL